MKNVVLDIKNCNWDLGPALWKERKWTIYDDMSVSYTILHNSDESDTITLNFKFTKDEFESIINSIELAKNDNTKVDACDGEGWEFIKYNNGEEIWKKDLGYIYGITSLESVANVLLKKLNSVIFRITV